MNARRTRQRMTAWVFCALVASGCATLFHADELTWFYRPTEAHNTYVVGCYENSNRAALATYRHASQMCSAFGFMGYRVLGDPRLSDKFELTVRCEN